MAIAERVVIGPQQRRWCDPRDREYVRGIGTDLYTTWERCRRCGVMWSGSVGRRGPCIDDAIPNWVGEG